MIFITLFLTFFCAAALFYALWPLLVQGASTVNKQQSQKFTSQVDLYLQDNEIQRARALTVISPIVFALVCFILFPEAIRLPGVAVGIVLGIVLPRMYVSNLIGKRKTNFNNQLVDALMIMSSSFRGGLSLIQAMEAVVDEMPDPTKREFGIVLGENKMGVALDESFARLQGRMPSVALQQMITAIVLARETGGNLPQIFSRIVGTIRERKKIEQNLQTLTIQGKIQALVMTGLPVFFVMGVSASNPKFFDVMFRLEQGKMLLGVSLGLWIIGAFFIWQISKFKDF